MGYGMIWRDLKPLTMTPVHQSLFTDYGGAGGGIIIETSVSWGQIILGLGSSNIALRGSNAHRWWNLSSKDLKTSTTTQGHSYTQ